ncbi:PKD domain-containing protein [Paraflavisolibacter sp. H34]|uniref:DUF7948 domain-containing protein n=1 Tax=Huijunlia imazamoxiresistens TaxID=3127457 RepID=UPI00301879A4
MKTIRHILTLLACMVFTVGHAQDYSNLQFIENKGQWDSRVRYAAEVPAGAVYIHQTGFTIVQHDPEDWQRVWDIAQGHSGTSQPVLPGRMIVKSHAYEVSFVDAAANPVMVADKPVYSHNNYFIGDDPSKWASDCQLFQGITVKELYPGVDLRYYSQSGRIKYDLIVKPGADPSRIALRYKGVENLHVKKGQLQIPTSVGLLKELYPYSYQQGPQGRQQVGCQYKVSGNTVRFDIKNYIRSSTLVIDPTLIFCSFSGSTVDNWGFTATYGPDGSFFGGGIVFGSGFPVSPGAFQTNFGGGGGNDANIDIGIIKLSPDGSRRIYATYIGGAGAEQPHSLVVDGQGNLVIAGRTNSTNYPTNGAGVIGPGGGYDIVVTKLNASGTALIGSRRIGGSGNDGVNINNSRSGANSLQRNYGDDGRSEVILDGAGNVYVASCTQSKDLKAEHGFLNSFAGGTQDGLLLKLTPNLSSLTYGLHIGGNGNDASYVLALHPFNNNIYIGGGTESNNLPATSGALAGTNQGGIDGFVSILSNAGSMQKTTYIGTGGMDQVYGVQFDKYGFPYVMGQTTGNWPIQNATWSQPGGKQFIAKLRPDLSAYVYSTAFGSGGNNPNISPVAFLVDRCENVYVSGWGGSVSSNPVYPSAGTTGLPVTPDAIKGTTDGNDFYFFVLKKDATAQLYGSFFGQSGAATDHVDGGTSRFDRNGVIYQAICANCKQFGPSQFPTTPGAWKETNPSSGCNLGMVKIAMDFSGVRAGPQSAIEGVPRDTAGCVPLTVTFSDTVRNALQYEWDFGDGSPAQTVNYPNTSISHTYNNVGVYRVRLIAIDSTTCNIRDTAYLNIRAGNLRAAVDFASTKISQCSESVFRYRFDNLSVAPPTRPFTAASFEWDFGDGSPRQPAGNQSIEHTYLSAGTYNVQLILVDTSYCNAPQTVQKSLRIAVNVKAQFELPPTGCVPLTLTLNNTSLAGQKFFWDFGDGTTSTEEYPTHTYRNPGAYTIRLRVEDPTTCNLVDSTRNTIVLSTGPTAEFSAAPQPPVVNTAIVFTNQSSSDAVRFVWSFGDGDSLRVNTLQPVSHEYEATGRYNACLIAYNSAGCPDTTCHPVEALVDPAVDVPTAFTPLSGDVNSKVFVRGFGIAKMHFAIWNRLGQKVFETNTKQSGWDGTFKGALQPMDVYAYTLEVEFIDGKKTTRKGDITLIR